MNVKRENSILDLDHKPKFIIQDLQRAVYEKLIGQVNYEEERLNVGAIHRGGNEYMVVGSCSRLDEPLLDSSAEIALMIAKALECPRETVAVSMTENIWFFGASVERETHIE